MYPEGHRMSDASKTGKLKTGMLRYAYERNIDTQIIIVVGIEGAFNEKKFHVSWGYNIIVTLIAQQILLAT